ncbi:aspartate aminotransferase family protein [Balneolaceae bacterium YR4-1]|uniref:Acetylornithine aminotransferase n=1 Tax=Halalkalibaculum roseum TaxID=2709311 RepID=A0A6M1SV94_9BACT|nr:aspartate aminotransferase family protein [Halalkalibaculum roseum]NGP76900.1 aspartate aminotransferase family protein [Halalkalibaculum roseum]
MDIKETINRFHLDVYNRFPITLVKGRGATVWDREGREYIDALAGIAVNSLGHCHPKVVKAIQEQASQLMHISNFYYSEPQSRLVELLADIGNMDRVFLCNSGAEAMEACLKTARKFGQKYQKKGPLITVSNAFHGRTMATISMGMDKYAKGYDPLLSGFNEVPLNDVKALEAAFDEDTLGVVLEPIQGSGGLHIASAEFMEKIQELCDKHEALFIVDEVQTGMGRTGRMFGYDHFKVKPDIVAIAKAMGGGFPIGAMLCRQKVADVMHHGDHGSTYGGNPLACAASHAAIKALLEENLQQEAQIKGEYLMDLLKDKFKHSDKVTDIRGKGLMVGVELSFNGRPVVERMLENGVLSNCTHGNVMRLVPPLVITEEELNNLADVLEEAINTTQ